MNTPRPSSSYYHELQRMVKTGEAWEQATVEISDCVQTPSKPTFSVTLADIMHHNEEHSFLAIPTVDWECSLQKYKSVD